MLPPRGYPYAHHQHHPVPAPRPTPTLRSPDPHDPSPTYPAPAHTAYVTPCAPCEDTLVYDPRSIGVVAVVTYHPAPTFAPCDLCGAPTPPDAYEYEVRFRSVRPLRHS